MSYSIRWANIDFFYFNKLFVYYSCSSFSYNEIIKNTAIVFPKYHACLFFNDALNYGKNYNIADDRRSVKIKNGLS